MVVSRAKKRKSRKQRPPRAERSTFHVDATKFQAPQLELFEIDHPLACIHRLQNLCQVRLRPRIQGTLSNQNRDNASRHSCQNVANRQGSQVSHTAESRASHTTCSISPLLFRQIQRTDGYLQMPTELSRCGTGQQRTGSWRRGSKYQTREPLSTNQTAN